jgi:hypothetical protein
VIRRPPRPERDTPAISAKHESRCLIFNGKRAARALEDPDEISELLKDQHRLSARRGRTALGLARRRSA